MRPLHLDLKGIIPSEKKFLKWLNWFRTRGFDALVLEYDCRVPWKVWAGAGSPLLTKSAVKRLVGHAEKLGFEVIPLIQIHGHLEWILKNPEYSFLRENGNLNELCPCHAESFPKMRRWIDALCRYAWEEKRLRPMLWDDMFCGGSFSRASLAARNAGAFSSSARCRMISLLPGRNFNGFSPSGTDAISDFNGSA